MRIFENIKQSEFLLTEIVDICFHKMYKNQRQEDMDFFTLCVYFNYFNGAF